MRQQVHIVRHKLMYLDIVLSVILQVDHAGSCTMAGVTPRFDLPIRFSDACVLTRPLTMMPECAM